MKKLVALILALMMCFTLAACAPAADDSTGDDGAATDSYVLKVSTTQAEGTNVVDGLNNLADMVAEATDGGLTLEVYAGSSLGQEEDLIEQALLGANICVRSDAGRCSNYVYDMGILNMAYFVDNYDEALKVVNSDTFKAWEEDLAAEGLRCISFTFTETARNFFINEEAQTPEDLNGLVIRCPGSDPYVYSIEALGATPYALAFSEIYNSMSTGAIDGCEIPVSSAASLYLNEVADYMIKTEHIFLINCLLVGETWFQELPEEYQTALMECAYNAGIENAKQEIALNESNLQTLVDGGMTVVEVDKAPFKEAANAAYEELGWTDLRAQIYEEIGKVA